MQNKIFSNNEILPNQENILKCFQEDAVNRLGSVFSLYEMINRESFEISSISLDGPWGSGKTFFIKMLIMLIKASSSDTDLNKEEIDIIINPEKRNIQKQKNFITPIYYDAWKNDSMSDPLLSLLYSICKQTGRIAKFETDLGKIAKSISKNVISYLLDSLTSNLHIPNATNYIESFSNLLKNNSAFVPIIDIEELNKNIKDLLNKVATKPLVVFIDELDRCKPPFAINLLESIKHYFNNSKILFIFSVNIEELQHSIKSIYGQNFNATRYLDRFFNLKFNLPIVDKELYLNRRFNKTTSKNIALTITEVFSKIYNLELRELDKVYSQVDFIINMSNKDSDCICKNAYDFTKIFFIPIAICLKFIDNESFSLFMSGNGAKIIKKLISNECLKRYCELYLKSDEEFLSDEELLSKVILVYKILLKKEKTQCIGKCIFFQNCSEWFSNKVGLLT